MSIGSYDYAGLIQTFLRQSQIEGSTAGDRMSFYGDRLYSYSSILAQLRTIPNGDTVLFIDKHISNYSPTTSRHTSKLRSINWFPVRMWNLSESYEQNLTEILDEIDELLIKHKRARTNKPYIQASILSKYKCFEPLYIESGLDKRNKLYHRYKKLPFVLFAHNITGQ